MIAKFSIKLHWFHHPQHMAVRKCFTHILWCVCMEATDAIIMFTVLCGFEVKESMLTGISTKPDGKKTNFVIDSNHNITAMESKNTS